jgi:hypothetical protein
MLLRLPLLLAIALLGLTACNDDDDDDDRIPTPTPTPSVTPTPTPSDDEDPTDGDSSGDDDSDTGDDTSGMPMADFEEVIGVTAIETSAGTITGLTVQRANGESWVFGIPAVSTSQFGDTIVGRSITYRNVNLVFGSTDGLLVFANGSVSGITSSTRLQ